MAKVLVVCGATASGKTSLAVSCAQKLNTQVVSADSLLVYRKLNIGTAKPDEKERGGVKHHMIDVVSPTENFSVSDYEKQALPIVEKLLSEGKTPVICGGTGFYINALLYKSQFGNTGSNTEIRLKYENIYKEKGGKYLHELLRSVDVESAEKLHENDVKRVIRALEIFEVTGKAKSAQHDEPVPRFDFLAVSVAYPRERLYERINARVDAMFAAGLVDEVNTLLGLGVDPRAQCMQGIGYKEVIEGIQSGLNEEDVKELIKKNTRNYAKRQETFFKRMQNHVPLPFEEATAERVLSLLE